MTTVKSEPAFSATNADAENIRSTGATCHAMRIEKDVKEAAMRVEKAFNEAKTTVNTKLEDARIEAERFGKRTRYAVEDGVREATHQIQRHPFNAVAIAFAAGAAVSFAAPHFFRRHAK